MAAQHQLRRSQNAVLGGVCAGIAEYFDADPVVVRILFAALTVLTLGAAVVPYAILCIAISDSRLQEEPLDVEPEEAHSTVFGNLDACAMRDRKNKAAMASALKQFGSAHMPPSPPISTGNSTAWSDVQQDGAQMSIEGSRAAASSLEFASDGQKNRESQGSSSSFKAAASADSYAISASSFRLKLAVAAALIGGSVLLSIGVSIVVSALVEGAVWWQCWPLILVVLGFVRMTVPGRVDRRSAMFASGVCSCALGLTLLMASLGIISWDSFGCMVENLWPLLAAYAALAITGIHLRNRALIVAAAFCFVLFCVLGLQLCAFPGPMHEFTFVTPLGREYPVVAPFSHVV